MTSGRKFGFKVHPELYLTLPPNPQGIHQPTYLQCLPSESSFWLVPSLLIWGNRKYRLTMERRKEKSLISSSFPPLHHHHTLKCPHQSRNGRSQVFTWTVGLRRTEARSGNWCTEAVWLYWTVRLIGDQGKLKKEKTLLPCCNIKGVETGANSKLFTAVEVM